MREWTVVRRLAPWRRVFRLFAWALGRYRHRQWPRDPSRDGQSSLDAEGELVAFVYKSLLAVLLLPLTVLELLAWAAAGGVLSLLRKWGLVRYRLDVLGYKEDKLYSETVLLVRGKRLPWLLDALKGDRRVNEHAFRPNWLPDDIEVRTHRSLWQSTGEWV
ncbi:hypothetical protein [Actinophytocola sp.]|uniref:hypothetical protein n=1 Tax=Actinophytocola sp. TaxID=1872138 RepID=UPI00389A5B8C